VRILLVHAHPVPESFNAALRGAAAGALARAGHAVDVLDLYAEGFDPVMSAAEREAYLADTPWLLGRVATHVQRLQRAEGLLFVFPTWYYGPPAMLKGWLERTWLPGVAFTVPRARGEKPGPGLQHIRWLGVITTSGSPWWWLKLIGDPGRALFMRGLRALMAPRCHKLWLQQYSMNSSTDRDRQRFLMRVQQALEGVR
jgi:NAD(P)H dehydrogenase (quinone)